MARSRAGRRGLVALLGGALALSGILAVPEAASAATSTRGLLAGLTVVAEHPRGLAAAARPRWSDLDADGCLTSQQVLLRDARTSPREAAGCHLTGGAWVGALDGARLTSDGVRVAQLVENDIVEEYAILVDGLGGDEREVEIVAA